MSGFKLRFKAKSGGNPDKLIDKSTDEVPQLNSENVPSEPFDRLDLPQAASSTTNNVVFLHWTSQPADKPEVHGLENEILALTKILKRRENDNDDQFKAIGVVGTRGVGKTTLCQEFFNLLRDPKEDDDKSFLPRIWVSVSLTQNDKDHIKTTVKEVLESLGVDVDKITSNPPISTEKDDNEVLRGLLYVLRLQLMGKRYLVVLDNVTEPVEITNSGKDSTLAYGFPKGYGGTVMVTSRKEEVVKRTVGDERNVHRLLPLSDPDSLWKIFCEAVIKGFKDNGCADEKFNWEEQLEQMLTRKTYEDLVSIGKKIDVKEVLRKKIIDKCNGIPLAAKLMAKTMSEQIHLSKNEPSKIGDSKRKVVSKDKDEYYLSKAQVDEKVDDEEREKEVEKQKKEEEEEEEEYDHDDDDATKKAGRYGNESDSRGSRT
ncbi:NB-ARC domain containing protein [Parasponia andersonii]|uniref:NB-ARC domain containing protein n=1 Tax=Parasponia andersonii TaxID=3476 RepID=A0A2P5B2V4_PARAD|nr:NB-ARC domain containing protein [Parasponia andersonii]